MALLVLAEIEAARGDGRAATEAARSAVETFTAYGDRRNAARALLALARAELQAGEPDAAVVTLTRTMGEFAGIGDEQGRAEAERLAQEARRRPDQHI